MTVSIIICTCNRAEHLRETLKSLSRVEVPPDVRAELIVVDNGSTDHTPQVVAAATMSRMCLRLCHEPRRGQTYARNTGLGVAKGDVIVFTDDDLRFPEDWIAQLCRPILDGQAEGVGGAVTLAPHLNRPWMEQIHRYWLAETGAPPAGEPVFMVGANMAFARDILGDVPGFDTELGPGALGFGDDTLFSSQALAAGHRIVYRPQAGVEHHLQEDRLRHANWLLHAKKLGQSKAYTAWHWEHRGVVVPRAQMMRKWLQVSCWRLRHPQERAREEGISSGQMYNLSAYHFYRQYLKEQRRPRNYGRHGLQKQTWS